MRGVERNTDEFDAVLENEQSPHAAIRGKIDRKVEEAVERETRLDTPEDREQVESVARELKNRSVAEVRRSEQERERARKLKRAYQFIAWAFYVVYGVIGLMIGLELLGARDWSGFMRFMRLLTSPLLAPFRGVMPDPAIGSFQLMLSYVLALVVYALCHKALKGAFRILVHREGADL